LLPADGVKNFSCGVSPNRLIVDKITIFICFVNKKTRNKFLRE
jgi:hypothetical protein